jgi:hypothetical protein
MSDSGTLRRAVEHPVRSDDALDRIWASLDDAHRLIRQQRDQSDDDRIESAMEQAAQAVERARAVVIEAVETIRDDAQGYDGATAEQLRRAFDSGFAAGSAGRRGNPFEDPFGVDWPGRRAHAAAWNRGRTQWESLHGEAVPAIGPLGSILQEAGLAASRDISEHRRRILAHQEKLAADQRTSEASDPQLRIPLIGEVRRPEPQAPKPRRAKTQKPPQPRLGEP